jgi:hypothetical protein
MGNSGDRESAEKWQDKQLQLEQSHKKCTANANGFERISSKAANGTQTSQEYHEDRDWNLRSPVRVIRYQTKETNGGFKSSKVTRIVSFRSVH